MSELSIRNLSVSFESDRGRVEAVRGFTLDVASGTKLGIIGESGSGKSVTALSVMQLHDRRRVRYGSDSHITLDGTDLLTLSPSRMRDLRGGTLSIVFQDPMTSLNPVVPVGKQINDVIRQHGDLPARERRDLIERTLREVGLDDTERILASHAGALSGGMRQRVLIAMAVIGGPSLLIADEPTSALDATVSSEVLRTMDTLVEERGMTLLLITHDMGVVSRICDRVAVMYGGTLVEEGPVVGILTAPSHPYTAALLTSLPTAAQPRTRLRTIPGVQSTRIGSGEVGCVFADRCAFAVERCSTETPALRSIGDVNVACHRVGEIDLTSPPPSTTA